MGHTGDRAGSFGEFCFEGRDPERLPACATPALPCMALGGLRNVSFARHQPQPLSPPPPSWRHMGRGQETCSHFWLLPQPLPPTRSLVISDARAYFSISSRGCRKAPSFASSLLLQTPLLSLLSLLS